MATDPFFAAIGSAVFVIVIFFVSALVGYLASRLVGGSKLFAVTVTLASFLILFFGLRSVIAS